MRTLYVLSVWLHIVAAAVWIGGMAFLILVVVPWLRAGRERMAGALLRETGGRFLPIAWIIFAILLATGTFNLYVRGVRPANLIDPVWLATPFGTAVALKLVLFAAIVVVSGVHDFATGRRASEAMEADPGSPRALSLRRRASLLGRLNALLALAIVLVAVMLVRGGIG